jgi:hypothetical protein
MSRSDRQSKRRTLGFENLESKTSLTSLVGYAGSADSADVAAVVGRVDESGMLAERTDLFLRYVSYVDDVDLERTLPSQSAADETDQWLMTNSPIGPAE